MIRAILPVVRMTKTPKRYSYNMFEYLELICLVAQSHGNVALRYTNRSKQKQIDINPYIRLVMYLAAPNIC